MDTVDLSTIFPFSFFLFQLSIIDVFHFPFSIILVWLGFLSLRGGIRFLNYVRQEIEKPASNFTPFASIIAPCRGLDQELRENLTALLTQKYPAYEIIFVVDDENDDAVSIIREISGPNSKLILAGKATNSGQKVHNLRRAILETSPVSGVFVFADSDARPNENWLRRLISPLENTEIGATTGYRWCISKTGNFASELRSIWNASIASALGANMKSNFCWGGAMAIRRETFERLKISEKWRTVVSDDFALTNALQAAKMPIYFVPQCLTASIEDCGLWEMLEFTTRQMKITRVYSPKHWKASLIGSFLFSSIFWTGILLVIFRAVYGLSFWLPLSILLLIFALGAAKAYLRLKAVRLVLPSYQKQLNRSAFWQLTIWFFAPLIYLYNSLCAAYSRRISWRGILYELKSPAETVIITQSQTD